MAKITRKGVFLGIAERKNGEWVVHRGNRVISRHATEAEADVALEAERLPAPEALFHDAATERAMEGV